MSKSATLKKGFKHLESAVGKAMGYSCHRYGFITHKLVMYWSKIVGKDLADISTPLQVFFQKGRSVEGTLVIGVVNPGFILELQSMEETIISKLSIYFGYKAISKIKAKIHKNPVKKTHINQQNYRSRINNTNSEKKVKKILISQEQNNEILKSIKDIKNSQLSDLFMEIKNEMFKL